MIRFTHAGLIQHKAGVLRHTDAMKAARPQTITNQIGDRIDQLRDRRSGYLAPGDFEYRRLLGEIDKLTKVAPYEGWVMRGTAATLTGDIDELRRAFDAAGHLAGDRWAHCSLNKAESLINLGLFSEARQVFDKAASVEKGTFSAFAGTGLNVGAITAVHDMFEQATKMNLQHTADVDPALAEAAAAIMREAGMSDDQVTAVHDLAGEVLRQHRARLYQSAFEIIELDGEPIVLCSLMVQRSAEELADMSFDLAELVAQMDRIPGRFHISFAGVA